MYLIYTKSGPFYIPNAENGHVFSKIIEFTVLPFPMIVYKEFTSLSHVFIEAYFLYAYTFLHIV